MLSNRRIPDSVHFLPTLEKVRNAFAKKAKESDPIVKAGRTHLQDAVPIRLGQEFRAYASIIDGLIVRYKRVLEDLKVLGIGGTAIGTGLKRIDVIEKRAKPFCNNRELLPYGNR